MSDQSHAVFVRRGTAVKGPVPFERVLALLKSGTLQPTDQVATSAYGPWTPLRNAVRPAGAELPVVESFTIKRSMFGGRYVAYYQCLKCDESLQSSESEMSRVETCTSCGTRYRLSPRAAQQARAAKIEHERQREMAAAALQQARERKAIQRQEAATRLEEENRRQAAAWREEEASRVVTERLLVERAAAARARDGACWYCGCVLVSGMPQCVACRMLVAGRVAGHTFR